MRLVGFNPFRPGRTMRPGVSRALRIETDPGLPAEVDVLVIGGGIAGVTAALHLREQGLRVTICEKGLVGAEQSSRGLGWVASLLDGPGRFELSAASKRLWTDYGARLGIDTTYRRSGLVLPCRSDDEAEAFHAWKDFASSRGEVDAELLSGEALRRRFPRMAALRPAAVAVQASDGGIEPERAVPLLAQAARRNGVRIVENCAVRGLETSAGAVSGAVTEHGPVRAGAVVVAAGAWSRLFCGSLGVDVPQLSAYATMSRLSGAEAGPPGCGTTGKAGWRRDVDGGCSFGANVAIAAIVPDSFRLLRHFLPAFMRERASISLDLDRDFIDALRTPRKWPLDGPTPFEENRILTSAPDMEASRRALRDLREAFGGLADARVTEVWGGVIDSTPDRIPVVSAVESMPGLFLCTGFSGHGLAMAPAAGRLVADLVGRRPTVVDPLPYRLSRFRP